MSTTCMAQAGQWTWVHGSKSLNMLGIFGNQGVPTNGTNPPSLYEPCQWTDTSGNFWLFGGMGYTYSPYGDMWMYNPKTNQWTWMNGTGMAGDAGYYGVKGVSSPFNIPPARS